MLGGVDGAHAAFAELAGDAIPPAIARSIQLSLSATEAAGAGAAPIVFASSFTASASVGFPRRRVSTPEKRGHRVHVVDHVACPVIEVVGALELLSLLDRAIQEREMERLLVRHGMTNG